MLVLKRKNEDVVKVRLTRETLQRLLDANEEPELAIRTYRIRKNKKGVPIVDLVFYDPSRNFLIDRLERIEGENANVVW